MLTTHATTLAITVTDTSTQLPRMCSGSAANEDGGRGLALLYGMGARLTVTPTPWGKAVKATLDFCCETPYDLAQ